MDKQPDQELLHAWAQLTRAQKSLEKSIEQALKKAGHPPLIWYDVLLELSRSESGHLRNRDLHQKMLLEKYNLSRLIDRMEAKGLVERRDNHEDARGSDIVITLKGRDLQKRIWPDYRQVVTEYFRARLTENQTATLNRLLDALKQPTN